MPTAALRRLLTRRHWARAFAAGGIRTWMAEPAARRAINRRVTGDEGEWPVEWLERRFMAQPLERALSVGCGDGALERDLRRKGVCRDIEGIDLVPSALERARQLAAVEGLDGIAYRRGDANRLELAAASFDAVFFHQALHHVERLEGCLDAVAAALRPGGLLYLDEYVGPSRHEWTPAALAEARRVWDTLPRRLKRRRRLPPPLDRRDPSEAIRSSEIFAAVAARFDIVERHDYGGNLLAVIHPHLDLDEIDSEERDRWIGDLLAEEERLLAAGAASFYAVVVARRRGETAGGGG